LSPIQDKLLITLVDYNEQRIKSVLPGAEGDGHMHEPPPDNYG